MTEKCPPKPTVDQNKFIDFFFSFVYTVWKVLWWRWKNYLESYGDKDGDEDDDKCNGGDVGFYSKNEVMVMVVKFLKVQYSATKNYIFSIVMQILLCKL